LCGNILVKCLMKEGMFGEESLKFLSLVDACF
jgi:hypothetical protein